jgi:hypothetical protein
VALRRRLCPPGQPGGLPSAPGARSGGASPALSGIAQIPHYSCPVLLAQFSTTVATGSETRRRRLWWSVAVGLGAGLLFRTPAGVWHLPVSREVAMVHIAGCPVWCLLTVFCKIFTQCYPGTGEGPPGIAGRLGLVVKVHGAHGPYV